MANPEAPEAIAADLKQERAGTREYRRESDKIVAGLVDDVGHMHECIESMKKEVERNTEVTEDIRDILASFRVVGRVAKWVAGVAAAIAAVKAGMSQFGP